MALVHALMSYKDKQRIVSFDMHSTQKATIRLASGRTLIVYMSDQYIVSESEVAEANENPAAEVLLYNNWDTISNSALAAGNRAGIEIHKFAAFGYRLDEINGRP
jgi:hypothetical protein